MALNLEKIKLQKDNSSTRINLNKVVEDIRVNLSWNSGEQKPKGFLGSLFAAKSSAIDLDLGVYVEMTNGRKLIMDPVQQGFQKGDRGSTTAEPWVHHSGDDRSGGGGETVMVSGAALGKLQRLVVYTFIYEGAARWVETDAIVRINIPGHADIEIPMGQQADPRKFCALAEIRFQGGTQIDVNRLITFHTDHSDCDKKYGWGFNWTEGGK